MSRRRTTALARGLVAALGVMPLAAPAQTLPARPPLPPVAGVPTPLPPSAAQADPDGFPPYEPQLDRLAERLGTLALLRELCGDGKASDVRDRMAALLDAEARSAPRRERLAGAYNRGFRGYAASYRSCTPSARLVIARSLEEVGRLTRELASRYAGT